MPRSDRTRFCDIQRKNALFWTRVNFYFQKLATPSLSGHAARHHGASRRGRATSGSSCVCYTNIMDSVQREAWLCLINRARQRRRRRIVRRVWVHDIILRRSEFGEFHHLLQELRQDESRFQRYFRLTCAQFDDLLARIGARITYQDTNYRSSIPANERLSICLR